MENSPTGCGSGAEPAIKDAAPSSPEPFQVQKLPIFDNVGEDLIATLLRHCSREQRPVGSEIIRQGELLDSLYIIDRGIVDLTRIEGEGECGVLLLSAKDLVMPAAALFGEPSLVTARALTTTKLILIDSAAVRSVIDASPQFATNLIRVMSGQWRMAVRNILDLNSRTAAQRLGAFLLRVADLQGDNGPAMLRIAKRPLAGRLGITPETLSRTLQIVAANGLHLRGRTILIWDRERIERFCGPDPYPNKDERSLSVYAF